MKALLIPRISPRLKGQGNETRVKSPHPGAIRDDENWVNIPAGPRLSPRWGGGQMTGALLASFARSVRQVMDRVFASLQR